MAKQQRPAYEEAVRRVMRPYDEQPPDEKWERFSILDASARDASEVGNFLFVGWDGTEEVMSLAETEARFGITRPDVKVGKRELVAFVTRAAERLPDDLRFEAKELLEAA